MSEKPRVDQDESAEQPGGEKPAPRELTEEERRRLKERLDKASKVDPNIYPVF